MKRIVTCAAATAIALGAIAAPAHAATVNVKDKDGMCTVQLSVDEQRFVKAWFDESKMIGAHEQARDFVAAVESAYPGVVAENEKALKGEKADFSKVLPAKLAEKYAEAQKTVKETKPTQERSLEDIDPAMRQVGPGMKRAEVPFGVEKSDAELYKAWVATPAGKVAEKQAMLDDADFAAAAACAKGTQADVAYPTATQRDEEPNSSKPELNVAAIVGGVIAAVLAIIGMIAALPQLGMKLPQLPKLPML